jgi:hypothetical protein
LGGVFGMTFDMAGSMGWSAPAVAFEARCTAVGGMTVGTLIATVLFDTPQAVSSSARMTPRIYGCQSIYTSLPKRVAGSG